jgi:FkbM family methyltransferase
MTTMRDISWNTSRFIATKTGPLSRTLYTAASVYVRSYKNLNYDMSSNGELHVLDRLSRHHPRTIVDVGANRGDYTAACLTRLPEATIHAFEIIPATFQKLERHIGRHPQVRLNDIGLSNADGVVEINYNPSDDGSSSIINGAAIDGRVWDRLTVEVTTGDAYCRANAVREIDLLKIDVEGAENLVLEGFREMFAEGRIGAVQFEFGMLNIYSKFLLRDFWELLSGYGFTLGPIMPNGVWFRDYNPRDEDFNGPPNFFAVHRTRPDLIEAVGRRK